VVGAAAAILVARRRKNSHPFKNSPAAPKAHPPVVIEGNPLQHKKAMRQLEQQAQKEEKWQQTHFRQKPRG
jgi:hypothetical protein